jgi:hypothetical protein
MDSNGMLHGGLDQLVFPICRDCDTALHLTREFAAVYVFPCHLILPIPVCPSSLQSTPGERNRPITRKPAGIIHYEEPLPSLDAADPVAGAVSNFRRRLLSEPRANAVGRCTTAGSVRGKT